MIPYTESVGVRPRLLASSSARFNPSRFAIHAMKLHSRHQPPKIDQLVLLFFGAHGVHYQIGHHIGKLRSDSYAGINPKGSYHDMPHCLTLMGAEKKIRKAA